ncbi:glyoxalase [Nocardia panacis]|uniref:Glyoxalase n=1 Tax=Nocardia panacis TaxID=2340916 RepID=A0A3A4K7Z3_9NOCA|nr:VOC family protein [Nocardia panacis]RJO69057.1 glyoxalase [Nocardia panacis]
MNTGLRTILFPVTDLAESKGVFTALAGHEPIADTPYYVGFEIAGQHLGLVPDGAREQGMKGPVGYWHVEGIAERIDELVAAGATVQNQPREVGGGRLVATLLDADGNQIGLLEDTAG